MLVSGPCLAILDQKVVGEPTETHGEDPLGHYGKGQTGQGGGSPALGDADGFEDDEHHNPGEPKGSIQRSSG